MVRAKRTSVKEDCTGGKQNCPPVASQLPSGPMNEWARAVCICRSGRANVPHTRQGVQILVVHVGLQFPSAQRRGSVCSHVIERSQVATRLEQHQRQEDTVQEEHDAAQRLGHLPSRPGDAKHNRQQHDDQQH
jgi:hypothetical protein